MLSRLLGAALQERHRLDITQQPEAARRLVGADLWPLIDPSAPPSDDSGAPGPDKAERAGSSAAWSSCDRGWRHR